jgi:uncharacterized protein YndB with AHSA1/START domain
MMLIGLLLCALLLASPAAAQDYESPPRIATHRDGDGGRAAASMDVRAPPSVVWNILSDCEHARRYIRELISCQVVERGAGWDVREHRLRGWPIKPVLRSISRVTLEPNRRIAFHRVGGDWTRSEGEWRLTPIDGGSGTHVEYDLDAAIPTPWPASWAQALLVTRMRSSLNALRREAEQEAANANRRAN